jgi:hypothetical protein
MSDREMDDAIHRAMRSGTNEPPLLTQVGEAMGGRARWINLFGVAVAFGLTGVGVWSAIRFSYAEAIKDIIMWAVLFLFCAQAVGLIKIWYWMVMNRNAVSREVKRLEYQVARLVAEQDRP